MNNRKSSNFTLGKRFMIETKIGSGSFGDVYLAKDTRSGQHVAVKIEYNNNEFSQICNESRIYLKLRN